MYIKDSVNIKTFGNDNECAHILKTVRLLEIKRLLEKERLCNSALVRNIAYIANCVLQIFFAYLIIHLFKTTRLFYFALIGDSAFQYFGI